MRSAHASSARRQRRQRSTSSRCSSTSRRRAASPVAARPSGTPSRAGSRACDASAASASPRAAIGCRPSGSGSRPGFRSRAPRTAAAPASRLPRASRDGSARAARASPSRVAIKKLRLLIVLLGLGLLAIVSTFFGMMMAISQDLPQLENKKEFAEAKNSVVLDDQGNKIGALLNNNQRILADSDQISPYMKQAAVAIEDKRFYEHGGVDIQGMARAGDPGHPAGWLDPGRLDDHAAVRQERARGAGRPNDLREVPRGRARLPARAPLDQGQDPHRVPEHHLLRRGRLRDRGGGPHLLRLEPPRAAAQRAATCAKVLLPARRRRCSPGIIASPSAFSPRANPQAATDRRNLVLKNMLDQGDITEQEYNEGHRSTRSRPPPRSSTRRTTPSPRTSPPGCASRSSTSTAPAAPSAAVTRSTARSTWTCRTRLSRSRRTRCPGSRRPPRWS